MPTFVEVAIDIEDATNSERTSCEAFLTKGSTFARVTYGLYIGQDRVESNEKYSRKLGML
ncbi:MAG: hypothetical protein EOP04_28675 [Proteobacteria bacterium]|nr:MAG: hypothetical protein EOP04_28675 [Pseudomonadota bacterium]